MSEGQNAPQMPSPEVCTVCGVNIQKVIPVSGGYANGRDVVIFATGAQSSRDVLYERVCRHVKDRPGCINKAL